MQPENERCLNRCRKNEEREHDGEVPPKGMPYMESEEGTFLPPHPPHNRHAEPQAVGGRDQKRWLLEYTVG